MAVTPAVYDMTVQRRSDHAIQLVFKDSNDEPTLSATLPLLRD